MNPSRVALNRAGQLSLLKPLRLENPWAIRRYCITQTSSLELSRCVQQLRSPRQFEIRSFTTTQRSSVRLRNTINKAKKDHPFLLPALFIASFASVCYLALLSYDEINREEPKLGVFPPAVEQHLRNAIWYTEIKPEPSIALDSFTRALEQAEKQGLDPFSDEFIGIHIRLAAALEKFGIAKGAIEILEKVANDMTERIQDIDLGRVTQRKVEKTEFRVTDAQGLSTVSVTEASPETQETERGRLLKKVIECKVKIAQLYESDYLQDNVSAKSTMDEAMKILVEAMRDPKSLQFDENRAGISADEAAAMFNQVGSSNMTWGNYGTALEIFKLALVAVRKANKGKPSCREAFTLSNMHSAVSMMLESPNSIIDGKPASAASIKQARQIKAGWAQQSLKCAQAVEPAEQDQLCTMAVISSWSGMASTLMELGDFKGAKRMWEQVIQMSESEPVLKQLLPIAHSALREIDEKGKRSWRS